MDLALNPRCRGERQLEKETAVGKREDNTIKEGTFSSGTSDDSLFTYGLATCVGMGAVGTAPLIGSRTDKVSLLCLLTGCVFFKQMTESISGFWVTVCATKQI